MNNAEKNKFLEHLSRTRNEFISDVLMDTKKDEVAQVDVSHTNDASEIHRFSINPQVSDSKSNCEKAINESTLEHYVYKKQNFRQFLRSLRESESDSSGPWLASSEDQVDAADDEGFVVAQTRCKKKKKSKILAENVEENFSKNFKSPCDNEKEMGDPELKNISDEVEDLECVFENVKIENSEIRGAEFESQVRKIETENKCYLNQLSNDEISSKVVELRDNYKIRSPKKTKTKQAWLYIPQHDSTKIIEFRECPICFTRLSNDKVILEECGHCFHSECIRLWMKQKKTCPFCAMFSLPPDEFPRLGENRSSITD